jgi:schlafen family protein
MPASEQEILEAIEAGNLIENATFDAKAALPEKGKSKELAKDVAAMANNGGTLLYGVGEDEHGRPTVPKPFKIAGARERVDQIVRASISEPPSIEVNTIPTYDDPSLGYLVVVVHPSPRAPHMVTAAGDNRYYGRGATGNVRLSEGEVARLYEQRWRWEIDHIDMLGEADMLDEVIASAPIEPHEDYAFLHLIARPMVPDEDLLDKARGDQHAMQFLDSLFSTAMSADVFPTPYSPDLYEHNNYEPRADGWATSRGLEVKGEERKNPSVVLDFEIGVNGSGRLFCGRAAERRQDRLLIIDVLVAGLTARFLAVMGGMYAAGGYLRPVDVGLAVTGLKGGISHAVSRRFGADPTPYDKNQYRRTARLTASTLSSDPRSAARKLVLPLIRVITRESYDPFSD